MKILGSALTQHWLLLHLLRVGTRTLECFHCSKASQSPLSAVTSVHQGQCGMITANRRGKQTQWLPYCYSVDSIGAQGYDTFSTEPHRLSQNATSHHVLELKQVLEMLGGTARQISRLLHVYHASLGRLKSKAGITISEPCSHQAGIRKEAGEGRADGPLWWPHECRTILNKSFQKSYKSRLSLQKDYFNVQLPQI